MDSEDRTWRLYFLKFKIDKNAELAATVEGGIF